MLGRSQTDDLERPRVDSLGNLMVAPSSEILDDDVNAINVIDSNHEQIHKGKAFKLNYGFTLNASSTVYIEVRVGSKESHFKDRTIINGTNELKIDIIENPTFTAGTTEIPSYNCKRSGTAIAATTKFYSNPGTPSGGAIIDKEYISGSNNNRTPMVNSNNIEWEYYPNNKYIIKIENLTNSNTYVLIKYFWYEI